MTKEGLFTGKSGKQYTFKVYSKSAQLPEIGGIYILTYTHPRGHLAGVEINVLDMEKTHNLNLAVSALQLRESLIEQCWNYNYILCVDEPELRAEILEDLLPNHPIQR